MGMILIFNRKVIPIKGGEKGEAKVETGIVGFLDGEPIDVGQVKFPSKQSWTKFWGAIQRGALAVPELEVKMQNVVLELTGADDEDKPEQPNEPAHRFIGAPTK